MQTSENLIALNDYLEENHRKNRQHDIRKMSKVGRHFDPLTDQERTECRSIYLAPLDAGNSGWVHQIPYDWSSASDRHQCVINPREEKEILIAK
jgi:hypothetical protein